MSDTSMPRPRSRRALGTTALGGLGLVTLALLTACSSSSASTTGTAAAAASAPAGAPSGAGGASGRARGPAASGLIAAADGSTLQVQSQQNGQVAVTWSASTTFTQQVKLAASAIKAGDCVTAVATSGTTSNTSFTATSVRVTTAVSGQCTGGFGGGGGGFPGGGTGARPSGAPSGVPSGATPPSGGTTRTGSLASGKVVSVSGSTLVVAARQFDRTAATPSAGSTPTTVDETVTVGAGTTITGEQAATSAAATVGRCATAQGTTDSSGAVTATSIAVTDAVNGACTAGFGGRRDAAGGTASGSTGA